MSQDQKSPSTSSIVTSRPRSIRQDLFLAVRLAWNFGYIIAIPAVVFGFGGASLDRQFGTSPTFILIGFAIALVLSGLGIWRVVRAIVRKQDEQ